MQTLAPEGRQREGVGRVDLAGAQPDRVFGQRVAPGEADPVHVRDRVAAHREEAEFPAPQTIEVEFARFLMARHRRTFADEEPRVRGIQAGDLVDVLRERQPQRHLGFRFHGRQVVPQRPLQKNFAAEFAPGSERSTQQSRKPGCHVHSKTSHRALCSQRDVSLGAAPSGAVRLHTVKSRRCRARILSAVFKPASTAARHKTFEPNIYPNLGLLTLATSLHCALRRSNVAAKVLYYDGALLGDEFIRTYIARNAVLDERACRLARGLAALGVGPGDRVGAIAMLRSIADESFRPAPAALRAGKAAAGARRSRTAHWWRRAHARRRSRSCVRPAA